MNKKSPWQAVKEKAAEAAKNGAPVWSCPYTKQRSRAVWLREFESNQQLSLFANEPA